MRFGNRSRENLDKALRKMSPPEDIQNELLNKEKEVGPERLIPIDQRTLREF